MNKYQVVKIFHDISGLKMPGDIVTLDDVRASKLRRYGLIGALAKTETPIETAPVIETATPKAPEVTEPEKTETATAPPAVEKAVTKTAPKKSGGKKVD